MDYEGLHENTKDLNKFLQRSKLEKKNDVIDSDGTTSGSLNGTSSNMVVENLESANSVMSRSRVNLGDFLNEQTTPESKSIRKEIVYFGIGLIWLANAYSMACGYLASMVQSLPTEDQIQRRKFQTSSVGAIGLIVIAFSLWCQVSSNKDSENTDYTVNQGLGLSHSTAPGSKTLETRKHEIN